jgi:hypothetical protein
MCVQNPFKHLILVAHEKQADEYIHRMGFHKLQCIVIHDRHGCDRVRGMNHVILHRTQAWYHSPRSNKKQEVQQMLAAYLIGRPGVTVLNEVDVVNTTFLS